MYAFGAALYIFFFYGRPQKAIEGLPNVKDLKFKVRNFSRFASKSKQKSL